MPGNRKGRVLGQIAEAAASPTALASPAPQGPHGRGADRHDARSSSGSKRSSRASSSPTSGPTSTWRSPGHLGDFDCRPPGPRIGSASVRSGSRTGSTRRGRLRPGRHRRDAGEGPGRKEDAAATFREGSISSSSIRNSTRDSSAAGRSGRGSGDLTAAFKRYRPARRAPRWLAEVAQLQPGPATATGAGTSSPLDEAEGPRTPAPPHRPEEQMKMGPAAKPADRDQARKDAIHAEIAAIRRQAGPSRRRIDIPPQDHARAGERCRPIDRPGPRRGRRRRRGVEWAMTLGSADA